MAAPAHLLWVARSGPQGQSWRAQRSATSAGRPIHYEASIGLITAEPGEPVGRPYRSQLEVRDQLGRRALHRLPDAADLKRAQAKLEAKIEAMVKASHHL